MSVEAVAGRQAAGGRHHQAMSEGEALQCRPAVASAGGIVKIDHLGVGCGIG